MFSSNPFSSSTNGFSCSNSFFDQEKDDVHFDKDPFFSRELPFHVDPDNVTTIKQQGFVMHQHQQLFSDDDDDDDDLLDSVISPYKKKISISKKDGHSKIYTARGPRDRRVRLSIGIAQKFFCLQDLLGFDKASKTLDWLLTKSITAIKDLVEETIHCSSSTITTDQSKVKFLESIKETSDEDKTCQKKKSRVDVKKKKMTQRCNKAGFQDNLARDQSRAEARARARERTKDKMRVKKTLVVPDCCESGCWGQIEPQNIDYEDRRWESIMDQETSKQSKDSSF